MYKVIIMDESFGRKIVIIKYEDETVAILGRFISLLGNYVLPSDIMYSAMKIWKIAKTIKKGTEFNLGESNDK